jgi:hypothetical protein
MLELGASPEVVEGIMSIWQKLTTQGGSATGTSPTLTPDAPAGESLHNHLHAGHDGAPDDLLTPANVSAELIKSVFEAAFMDVRIDSDGDVLVKDAVNVFIRVAEKKDRLRLFCLFGFKAGSSTAAQLQCVNLINSEYIMVTASAQGTKLIFRYDLLLGDGLSKRSLVQAVKMFAGIPQPAAADHGRDIVE